MVYTGIRATSERITAIPSGLLDWRAVRTLCHIQGTQEWHAQRAGRITASAANYALAAPGGKGRTEYIEQLADDIEGVPNFADVDNPPWFAKGRFYESWARGWYSFTKGVDVKETGFIVHDDYSWLGCSPDGLVGNDGLVEIKFRHYLHTFNDSIEKNIPRATMAQIQTQLFVTGREWCDYVNYWRDEADQELEKGHCVRIARDDQHIDEVLLPAFVGLWADVQLLLDQRKKQYTVGGR